MRNFSPVVNVDESQYLCEISASQLEGQPCYAPSPYDAVMFDKLEDGSVVQCDMVQILLHQEVMRNKLGDSLYNEILKQMHPTPATRMDEMSDDERFNCIISRHCQTMSERQAVLQDIAENCKELKAYAEYQLNLEQENAPAAPAPTE